MKDVSSIDSSGLGELIHLAAAVSRSGGAIFSVVPANSFLHELLVRTKIAPLMYFFESQESALECAQRWVLENC